MYSTARRRRRERSRLFYLLIFLLLIAVVFFTVSQSVQVTLNLWEFGDLFVKPIYFSLLGGFVLSFLALFRLDFKRRPSLTFWLIGLALTIYRGGGYIYPRDLDFSSYRLSPTRFLAWQLTKTILGAIFFADAIFGMTLNALARGVDMGIQYLPEVARLPFTSMTAADVSPALTVISASPPLILLLPPILTAIGFRLFLLVGATIIAKASAAAAVEYLERGVLRLPIDAVELVIAIGSAWTGFNLFFTSYIDYNTKILILGAFLITVLMLLFVRLDKTKPGFLYAFAIKGGAIFLILLAVFAAVTIQNSIADARKVEWLGPYVRQEITVNRYLADIEDVKVVRYNFTEPSSPLSVKEYTSQARVRESLAVVRLWDWEAAFTKMKPEIGLIPYVDFEDSDILRFNGRLYWSASMKPILPESVTAADVWYNEHLVYTHVPNGFLLLDASTGTIVDSSKFFKQRRIYYGEGGLLESTWAAIIFGKDVSDEVTGTRYSGTGGVVVSPPMSWLYDVTFLLSYPDKSVRILRYRDVYDRMGLLFPYFEYTWGEYYVDMFPVTDGENTYWLMPLIIKLSAEHVPWSRGNYYVRFIGYALIDIYNGTIQLIITEKDFVSQMIREAYREIILPEVPEWLMNQTRFPYEVFEYQVERFNTYHVDDVATFIQAREFYEIPPGLYSYYIIAHPPGFNNPEFVGLLSLQLRGSPGRNLAGFIVVRNDYPHLGEKILYSVPLESEVKLLGPSAAREALERFPEFRKLQTLLENPRIGETILYQVGDFLVYFIPVYTSPTEARGVVTQLGTVAVVGAEFTGRYFVGMGDTVEEAFEAFLRQILGEAAPPSEEKVDVRNLTLTIIEEKGLTSVFPEEINAHLVFQEANITYFSPEQFREELGSFLDEWVLGLGEERVLVWREENVLKIGVLRVEGGVVELHYAAIYGG